MKTSGKRRYPATFLFLLLSSALMIFPFVWLFLSAFKTSSDVYHYPPKWLPSSFQLGNFAEVFKKIPFLRFYANSLFIGLVQTVLQIAFSAMGAFALTKLIFPGRK